LPGWQGNLSMNQSAFAIGQFPNRNGTTSWRVDGRINGVRIRKNFKSREEAAAEKAALELKALQSTSNLRSVATTLTEDQAREAEAIFLRLADKPRPLSFYVDFALSNYREPENQKSLKDAIADYNKAKAHECEQGQICHPQLNRIGWDLARLEKRFPKRAVAELTVPALVEFLEIGRASMKTYNNRRGVLSTFFKYAFHRGWIAENPIPKVPHYRIRRKRGSAVTFSAHQAAELMAYCETHDDARWVPYFALCLFAGIRPGVPDGEITKIKPEDVNLETGIIAISADASNREVERLAMEAVMAQERSLGNEPRDVAAGNLGYDIESRDPKTNRLRFIEVKGRVWTADTITVTANEIRTAMNQPEQWFLALVYVNDGKAQPPQYVQRPFTQEPEFAEASRTLRIRDLLER